MTSGKAWHRQDWHRLTIAEKVAEQRRRHDEKFLVREFRCRRCLTVVDAPSRAGHNMRCFNYATPCSPEQLDAFFTPIEIKGAGWRVDVAALGAVQLPTGGLMAPDGSNGHAAPVIDRELAAAKREFAKGWAREQVETTGETPTAVSLITAVRDEYKGSGLSNRVAAKILSDVRAEDRPKRRTHEKPAGPEWNDLKLTDVYVPETNGGGAPGVVAPPVDIERATAVGATCAAMADVVGVVLDAVAVLRRLGAQSFTYGGREFAVP